jgi:hypothetical protein
MLVDNNKEDKGIQEEEMEDIRQEGPILID